jgi:hypothetical protein
MTQEVFDISTISLVLKWTDKQIKFHSFLSLSISVHVPLQRIMQHSLFC